MFDNEGKKKNNKKQLIELHSEKPSRLLGSSQYNPKPYNRFDQEANAVDIQKFLQSGDALGGSANTVKEGGREEQFIPSIPVADLTLRVYTKIYQSDGRPLKLETQRNDFFGEAGSLPTSLKRRVAVWSASGADLYDTVNVATRTGTPVKVTGTIESQRDDRLDAEYNLIDERSGSYLYDGDYSTPYAYDGGNSGWLLMQREDNNQVFIGYYDSNNFVQIPVPASTDPQSPISASIYRIDNGAGGIINDGTDTLAVTGSTMVGLTKITGFTGTDSIARSLNPSATSSIADHSQFKCTARIDLIGGSQSGYAYYGISSDMLPLVTGKVISEGVSSVGGGNLSWPGTNDIVGKNFLMSGKIGELYPESASSDYASANAYFIISASSDGTITQATRIDNGLGSVVNDGSDGLTVCT